MIFKGEPNLFVRFSNPYIQRAMGKIGFHFNANGEYETNSELLIKVLSQHFEQKIEKHTEVEQNTELPKIYKCKKCDFTTEKKGELLAHYKEKHPKED